MVIPAGTTVEGEFRYKTAEEAVERRHRHRMEARAFLIKEAPVHIAAVVIIVVCLLLSVWVFCRPGASKDDRQWAMPILSYLLVAVAGFAFGKAAK